MYSFMGIWAIAEELLTFEVIAILRNAKTKQNKDSRWKQTTIFVVEKYYNFRLNDANHLIFGP